MVVPCRRRKQCRDRVQGLSRGGLHEPERGRVPWRSQPGRVARGGRHRERRRNDGSGRLPWRHVGHVPGRQGERRRPPAQTIDPRHLRAFPRLGSTGRPISEAQVSASPGLRVEVELDPCAAGGDTPRRLLVAFPQRDRHRRRGDGTPLSDPRTPVVLPIISPAIRMPCRPSWSRKARRPAPATSYSAR